MGSDPSTSVVNNYLHLWDISNLFVAGGSAFPQNPANCPTETIDILACWAADAIKNNAVRNAAPWSERQRETEQLASVATILPRFSFASLRRTYVLQTQQSVGEQRESGHLPAQANDVARRP